MMHQPHLHQPWRLVSCNPSSIFSAALETSVLIPPLMRCSCGSPRKCSRAKIAATMPSRCGGASRHTPQQQKPRTAKQHAEACCYRPLLQCMQKRVWRGHIRLWTNRIKLSVHCANGKRPCGLLFHALRATASWHPEPDIVSHHSWHAGGGASSVPSSTSGAVGTDRSRSWDLDWNGPFVGLISAPSLYDAGGRRLGLGRGLQALKLLWNSTQQVWQASSASAG